MWWTGSSRQERPALPAMLLCLPARGSRNPGEIRASFDPLKSVLHYLAGSSRSSVASHTLLHRTTLSNLTSVHNW